MKKVALVGLVVLALLMAALPVGAQDGGNSGFEFKGSDDPVLLQKLFGYFMGAGYPSDQTVTVWVGELPEEMDASAPEGATIVGAVVTDNVYYPNSRIFLETNLAPEAVIDFYTNALEGWELVPASYGGPIGFVDQNYGTYATFCSTEQALNVNAQGHEDGNTTIFIDIYPAYGGSCQGGYPPKGDDAYRYLPVLTTPEGITLATPMGGGGGGGPVLSASADALMRSELPLEAIAAAYNAQLQSTDWTLVSQSATDLVAASTWTFSDDQDRIWGGILTFVANPTVPGEYVARVVVSTSLE
jgi:hypothetical protein